ncbi:MAG: B12-binding domain-containing radical SAM protein [Acidobacteria bacterium]|nr:B12-binding domain-containing radical SAM protein [Acidobacteriota bacterium]
MRIGLIAIAGVKMQTRKFIELGVTLPQFMNRGRVIAQLPSLALLTLAGATPENVDVEYVEVDDVRAHAAHPRMDFDFVALSTYTARAFDAYLVADAYRAEGVPVVFGGLHATVCPEEVAWHADAVVVGEGELLWPEVVRDFQREGVRGLKRFYREPRPGQFDLAHAPMPRYDLLAQPVSDSGAPAGKMPAVPDARHSMLETGEIHRLGAYNRITVQTTRGCPWDCEFCAASKIYGPKYRLKPVTRVLEEVDAVRAMWRRPFIEFADDNTFVNRAWSKSLLRGLAERNIRYFTESDVSLAEDEELLDLLYPSGCRQVLIGFESPRRASLVGMDRVNWKAGQIPKYLDAIEKIQSRGVSVCGCFIVGLDGDTPESFDEIREFVDHAQLLEVQVTIWTAFPGTRLYDRLLREGRILRPGAWDHCTLFDVNFQPRGMTVEQLEEGVMQLWRDCWNAQALAERKRHYRQLLRARRSLDAACIPEEAEEYFAITVD